MGVTEELYNFFRDTSSKIVPENPVQMVTLFSSQDRTKNNNFWGIIWNCYILLLLYRHRV